MFDIYSLAKPRVFMMPDVGGNGGSQDTDDTQEERYTPELVRNEKDILGASVTILTAEMAAGMTHPEAEGRVDASAAVDYLSNNVINTVSDLGGAIRHIKNESSTERSDYVFRTEFRPKQGLHNLDFTTPAETPSDETPSEDAQ